MSRRTYAEALEHEIDRMEKGLDEGRGPQVAREATAMLQATESGRQRIAELRTAACRQARDLYSFSYSDLGKELGVSSARAHQIVNNRTG